MKQLVIALILSMVSAFRQSVGQNSPMNERPTFTEGARIASGGAERLVADSSDYINIFSRIRPLQPAPQAPGIYPLGNDLSLETSGPADLHLKQNKLATTTTNPLRVGSN